VEAFQRRGAGHEPQGKLTMRKAYAFKTLTCLEIAHGSSAG
jgi:hypothetical protein